MKHLDDFVLQEIAQNDELYSQYELHLNVCERCRDNLSFYQNMFPLLSKKLEGDFSPEFAVNIISQATLIENRNRKVKSGFVFALIIMLSVIPFVLFPGSLSQFTVFGKTFSKFFELVKANISKHNISLWSLLAVVLLVVLIQLFEHFTKTNLGRKNRHV